jgi:hypothetical protein
MFTSSKDVLVQLSRAKSTITAPCNKTESEFFRCWLGNKGDNYRWSNIKVRRFDSLLQYDFLNRTIQVSIFLRFVRTKFDIYVVILVQWIIQLVHFVSNITYSSKWTLGEIKNGQHRKTGNIGNTRRRKAKRKHNTTRKQTQTRHDTPHNQQEAE